MQVEQSHFRRKFVLVSCGLSANYEGLVAKWAAFRREIVVPIFFLHWFIVLNFFVHRFIVHNDFCAQWYNFVHNSMIVYCVKIVHNINTHNQGVTLSSVYLIIIWSVHNNDMHNKVVHCQIMIYRNKYLCKKTSCTKELYTINLCTISSCTINLCTKTIVHNKGHKNNCAE